MNDSEVSSRELRVLSLDSSTIPCASLHRVGHGSAELLGSVVLDEPRDLSRRLVNVIDDVLQQANATLDDVDLLAVGLGPGSWTGLRIGVSAMKTLAQVRALPIVGVGTFEAMHAAVSERLLADPEGGWDSLDPLILVAPSRPGEIYGASTFVDPSSSITVKVASPREIASEVSKLKSFAFVAALDEAAHREAQNEVASELRAFNCEAVLETISPAELLQALAILAARRFRAGAASDALRLEPLYLAPSNAERVRNAKLEAQRVESNAKSEHAGGVAVARGHAAGDVGV